MKIEVFFIKQLLPSSSVLSHILFRTLKNTLDFQRLWFMGGKKDADHLLKSSPIISALESHSLSRQG